MGGQGRCLPSSLGRPIRITKASSLPSLAVHLPPNRTAPPPRYIITTATATAAPPLPAGTAVRRSARRLRAGLPHAWAVPRVSGTHAVAAAGRHRGGRRPLCEEAFAHGSTASTAQQEKQRARQGGIQRRTGKGNQAPYAVLLPSKRRCRALLRFARNTPMVHPRANGNLLWRSYYQSHRRGT